MTEPKDNSATGVFGRLQVRLDPWQPEFGPEFAGFDEMTADGPESVDIELERPRDHWEPIGPELNWPPERPVWFIDGVRRLEARVTAKLDGQYSYGAFGAYGVGAVQQLSQDLRGDAFQQYLLEGSFRRLVAGASDRLRELNERYGLAFTDGKFSVIDHDHGSQSRLADTLSGGETFLVSLALALELSEQVQQAAGAVRLDSLFIDEGFGTLDPETLDTVADAIESLSKTNRMVGVITHVAALHRRLPRLEVRPTESGSTVHYVED